MGLAVWAEDEAGPYSTRPYAGQSWAEHGWPKQPPHEYVRNGTAKLLTLFCPRSGEVRARDVIHATNAMLHPWLQQKLAAILESLPQPSSITDANVTHAVWELWQQKLQNPHYVAIGASGITPASDLGQPPGTLDT